MKIRQIKERNLIMGMLDSLFGTKNNNHIDNKNSINWIELIELSQLEELRNNSKDKLVVIFKHSTRCGISRSVLRKFEKATKSNDNVAFYFLDLIKYRNISNAISSEFNVHHQSPQVILIKNKISVANESHYDIISALTLSDYI